MEFLEVAPFMQKITALWHLQLTLMDNVTLSFAYLRKINNHAYCPILKEGGRGSYCFGNLHQVFIFIFFKILILMQSFNL